MNLDAEFDELIRLTERLKSHAEHIRYGHIMCVSEELLKREYEIHTNLRIEWRDTLKRLLESKT